jgi:serine/threonine protein kinase
MDGHPVYNGRYELVRQVARGGMAEVYLARDQLLDRPVALKVLFPELSVDRTFVERFRREAQAAANLSHPHIVPVYDWGESDQTYFIVMEYVDGDSLSARLRTQGPMLSDDAARVGTDVASALDYAHRHGVIHRDVKPGNVLITQEGSVKVADFGIARAGADESLTQTGMVMGTATYFSPEQAQGTAVDARSDVYSLGVVLYEMVCGAVPFTGENPVAIAYKHVREAPPDPRSINPAIPDEFCSIIARAMAKDAANRYQSAAELGQDLQRYVNGQTISAPLVAPLRSGRRVARTDGTATVASRPTEAVQSGWSRSATGVLPLEDSPTMAVSSLSDSPSSQGSGRVAPYVVLLILLLAALGVVVYLGAKSLGLLSPQSSSFALPSVIGKSYDAARQELVAQHLAVIEDQVAGAGATPGTVTRTNPAPGSTVRPNQTVTLYVAKAVPTFAVPSLVGLPYTQAQSILTKDGFFPNPVSVSSSKPSGTVLSQSPSAGSKEPANSTVNLNVSSGPNQTYVPDVLGDSPAQAASALASQNLQVASTSQTESSSSYPTGEVAGTDPAPGTAVAPGTTVTLLVSTGPAATVAVPDVVGDTPGEASAKLEAAGLAVKAVNESTTDPGYIGYVINQSPTSSGAVAPGATVTIFVGVASSSSTTSTTTPGSTTTTVAGTTSTTVPATTTTVAGSTTTSTTSTTGPSRPLLP